MAKSAAQKLASVTSVPERSDVGFKLTDVVLVDEQDRDLDWDIWNSVLSARVDLTMSGASTIQIQLEDADYAFMEDPVLANWAFTLMDVSPSSARNFSTHRITSATNNSKAGNLTDFEWLLGQRPIDLYLDTIAFRLCQIQTQKDLLTLTFEDRIASLLRDKKGLKTAVRGQTTRAGFVQLLCKEAGVPYFIPEVDVVQPVQTTNDVGTAADLRSTGGAGLTTFSGITVKGQPASQAQIDILNTALAAAVSHKAPYKAQVALVEALIQENDVSNPNPGDPGDRGCLSMIDSTVASTGLNPYDVAQVCAYFLTNGFFGQGGAIQIAQGNPTFSADQIAQAVQGSAFPKAYGQWDGEAQKIVQAYGGGGLIGTATTTTVPGAYSFTRGPNETSWDCIQRLASEVQWYAFVRENRLWFVSGNYLFSQQPQLEVRMGINGIDYVDVNLDTGARDQIAECDVYGRAHLWTALPGMTVQVTRRGPANGKWSTEEVQLDLLDEANGCQITLQKPLPARAEPASTTVKTTSNGIALLGTQGYVNPFSQIQGLTPERIDMGVDYAGSGPILALGNATVYAAMSSGSGWPGGGFVGLKLLDGPYAGKFVYHAENITPLVSAGQTVKAGQPIATLHPGSPNSESGWASGKGTGTLAAELNQQDPNGDPGGWASAAGLSFNRLLVALGAPSGTGNGPGHGTMPAGYP